MKTTCRVQPKYACTLLILTVAMILSMVPAAALELVPAGSFPVTTPRTSARGVALSLDESVLYIGGIQDRNVIKLDIATGAVVKTSLTVIDTGAYGKATWVDAKGNVWAPLTTPFLATYSPDMQLLASYDLRPFGITNPEGVAIGLGGEIYVTDRNSKRQGIYKFIAEGGQLVPVKNWGDNGFVALGDLRVPVLTASGDLLLNAYGAGRIYLVKAGNGSTSLYLDGVKNPYYIALDGAGRLWVGHYDRKDAAVSVYDANGSLLKSWTKEQLGATTAVSGIAVSKDGKRLYVLDQQAVNGVLMFDVK